MFLLALRNVAIEYTAVGALNSNYKVFAVRQCTTQLGKNQTCWRTAVRVLLCATEARNFFLLLQLNWKFRRQLEFYANLSFIYVFFCDSEFSVVFFLGRTRAKQWTLFFLHCFVLFFVLFLFRRNEWWDTSYCCVDVADREPLLIELSTRFEYKLTVAYLCDRFQGVVNGVCTTINNWKHSFDALISPLKIILNFWQRWMW